MEHLLLSLDQITISLALCQLLIQHVNLVLLLLSLRPIDLSHDLLLLQVLDLLLFLDDLLTKFLSDLAVLHFAV